MKFLTFSLFGFFLAAGVYGQNKVTGKILTRDGKGIPSANVYLLNPGDSSLVKGCMANEAGEYQMEGIDPGKYFLKYTAVGFRAYNSPLFELASQPGSKSFGAQVMEGNAQQLNEVVVVAEKPLYQQQIDGLVVNVEGSVLTKGSSVLDVLERSPGVFLDRTYNSIALNGKRGVMVMLNGKALRMPLSQVSTLLRGMSADNIEKIELLTTPPAKYDAEGDAGIINIVVKKSKKYGTNGSFSVTGGYGYKEKGSANINLDHNVGNLDVYGAYTFSHDRFHVDWSSIGSENVPLLGGQTAFNFSSDIKPVENDQNANAGFNAKLGSKTTIGSDISYNYSHATASTQNFGQYIIQPDSFMQLNAAIGSVTRWDNLMSSFYAERRIREGERINFDVDYLYYNNSDSGQVQSVTRNKEGNEIGVNDSLFAPSQRSFSNTVIRVGVGKIDYLKSISKKVNFETGVKATYTVSSGSSTVQSLQHGQWSSINGETSGVNMKESIEAMYASFNVAPNPVTKVVIGARYEYSDTRMDDVETGDNLADRKLGELFPSFFFSRKLSEKSELQFSYTKRISRPSYIDLANFIQYNDPISVFTGNPLLRPTITNNLKAGYIYKGYSLSVLLDRDDYPIARYQVVKSTGGDLVYIAPQNMQYQNNLVLEMRLPFKVKNWWDMNYSFVGGWRKFSLDYTVLPVEKAFFDYSIYGMETFRLPGSFSVEISGWYNSSTYSGSKTVQGVGAVNGGIKKELKNNWGSLQLVMTDILRTSTFVSAFGAITQEAFNLKSSIIYNPESRRYQVIKLTYSKSFGNSTSKSRRSDVNGSMDERDRIRRN